MKSINDPPDSCEEDEIKFDKNNRIKMTESSDAEEDNISYIKQYVSQVLDFSSQYGSDISISYTACNIIGKPNKFPNYGDFPQTYVLRTYGKWWKEAPSRQIEYMPQNRQEVEGEDYIDLFFECAVYPWQILIYETYNPGAVVRIWCGKGKGNWCLLWEDHPVAAPRISRAFVPPIQMISFPTNVIRLEFNQSLLGYHTEIDAVMLLGSLKPVQSLHKSSPVRPLCKKLQNLRIGAAKPPGPPVLDKKHINDLLNQTSQKIAEQDKAPPSGSFSVLPDETIIKILGYLDLFSLARCAMVNKRFSEIATDALLYTSISLKPYWHRVDRTTLRSFSKRCRYLQKLDLSWCGSNDKISANDFSLFIKSCGTHLTHLKLNCCKFINDQALYSISRYCFKLKELCLRNCNTATQTGFNSLSQLTVLERLDLYRVTIEASSLISILRGNPKMKHLNVGGCGHISAMDDVAFALSSHNPNLISVDFWKSYSLSPFGVHALENCHYLEELDIGWCLSVGIPGSCLLHLAKNCPNIKRLVLSALRGLTDTDMIPVLDLCMNLEQLDLLGLQGITAVTAEKAFKSCKKLKLLDISFCEQISDVIVEIWKEQYPNVSIKRSFQADMRDEINV